MIINMKININHLIIKKCINQNVATKDVQHASSCITIVVCDLGVFLADQSCIIKGYFLKFKRKTWQNHRFDEVQSLWFPIKIYDLHMLFFHFRLLRMLELMDDRDNFFHFKQEQSSRYHTQWYGLNYKDMLMLHYIFSCKDVLFYEYVRNF